MIELGKQYRMRDGRDVRIYAVDGGGEYPVHGATKLNGQWLSQGWTECGGYDVEVDEHEYDLVEVKPRIKRKVWVNVYPYGQGVYSTKEKARAHASDARTACVEIDIDVEEGHGL